jgi:short-subunit dehydrogenase
MHRLHVTATTRLCRIALEGMVRRDSGAIVNVASISAFLRRPGGVSYAATKSWMAVFTEGLYIELKSARSAVKVQALCPGFTYSEFHDAAGLERSVLAPPSYWMAPEQVVAASLAALRKDKLYVIPGRRYKMMTSLFTKVPTAVRLILETRGPRRRS